MGFKSKTQYIKSWLDWHNGNSDNTTPVARIRDLATFLFERFYEPISDNWDEDYDEHAREMYDDVIDEIIIQFLDSDSEARKVRKTHKLPKHLDEDSFVEKIEDLLDSYGFLVLEIEQGDSNSYTLSGSMENPSIEVSYSDGEDDKDEETSSDDDDDESSEDINEILYRFFNRLKKIDRNLWSSLRKVVNSDSELSEIIEL